VDHSWKSFDASRYWEAHYLPAPVHASIWGNFARNAVIRGYLRTARKQRWAARRAALDGASMREGWEFATTSAFTCANILKN